MIKGTHTYRRKMDIKDVKGRKDVKKKILLQ